MNASRVEWIFAHYLWALKEFDTEPYPLPEGLTIDNFLTWLEEEFGSLGEVFSIAGDNFAMTSCDGFINFMRKKKNMFLIVCQGRISIKFW